MIQITKEVLEAMNDGERYIIHNRNNSFLCIVSRKGYNYFLNSHIISLHYISSVFANDCLIHADSLIQAYYTHLS